VQFRYLPLLRAAAAMRLAATLSILLTLSPAQATSFCASSVAQINSALALGSLQSQPYTIQIVQGSYPMNANMVYSFPVPVTIEGGYTANCAGRQVNAANTVINIGADHSLSLTQADASPEASINVDGLTFSNANTAIKFEAGAVLFNPVRYNPGSVSLTRVRFTQINVGAGQVPLSVTAHSSAVLLDNVLIDHVAGTDTCAVDLRSDDHATISINHLSADLAAANHFCLTDFAYGTQVYIHNSILWNSGGGQSLFRGNPDFPLNPVTSVALINDVFHGQALGTQVSVVNQINASPVWQDPVNGNYRLATNPSASPAINSGTIIVPGGESASDIEGNLRVIGSAPDRGAYESAVNNFSNLTVTNTLDSGAGSLRQALLDANSSPNIAKSIKFDIRGAGNVPLCPAVIALASVLPEVAATMLIDGYTQPTSSANTDATAFNAHLCVLLKPASGSLSTAFRVPAGAAGNPSLTLRGLGLGGFGQPVQILGGSDHQISGNQFGGVISGVALPGAGLSAITFGVNAVGNLIVGGQNLADRNVIGDAGFNGISIQAGVQSSPDRCQIVNNLIGLTANGHSQLANNVGININGSGCSVTRNRVAGNTAANIWLNGGSSNIVQQNQIGASTQNIGFINNAAGILISGSNNIIGASGNGGTITANTVRFMVAGGIVVQGDSALNNSINANFVFENGLSGNGMDIDLVASNAAAGPTANDPGDGDSGANGLQNFPVPTQLTYTGPGTGAGHLDRPAVLSAVLDSQPGTYRVDAYFSSAINTNGQRGHAELFLGRSSINVGNAPTGFAMAVVVPNQLPGGVISLTATNAAGNTSEIGSALSIVDPLLFANGYE
jgi:trimeric autotransporter adhesin